MLYGNAIGAVVNSSLGAHQAWVMVAVLSTMEGDGNRQTPGVSTASVRALAEKARVSSRAAQRALSELVEMGWLRRIDTLGKATVWHYSGSPPVGVETPAPRSPLTDSHPCTTVTPAPQSGDPRTTVTTPPHHSQGSHVIEPARYPGPRSDPFPDQQHHQDDDVPRSAPTPNGRSRPIRNGTPAADLLGAADVFSTDAPDPSAELRRVEAAWRAQRPGETVMLPDAVARKLVELTGRYGPDLVIQAIEASVLSLGKAPTPNYLAVACEGLHVDPTGERRARAGPGTADDPPPRPDPVAEFQKRQAAKANRTDETEAGAA